jgi:hypothetical protein
MGCRPDCVNWALESAGETIDGKLNRKKVNQWQFRSPSRRLTEKGTLHHSNVFYNGGKLSGDLFLAQFMWVTLNRSNSEQCGNGLTDDSW